MPIRATPNRSREAGSATPATAGSNTAVHLLGRLAFLGDRLLAALVGEAEAQRPEGRPGDVLSRLAVSTQLREAVSAAAGEPLVSTYAARYQYHGPGMHQRPHRDGPGYDLVFHLTLAHEHPTSVLLVEGRADPVALVPGHGLVLRGQDATHCWTPLADDERRTLLAVGFHPAP